MRVLATPLRRPSTPPAGGAGLAYGPAAEPIRPRTVVESCARWLLEVLAASGRPMSLAELERPARRAGYSRATLPIHGRRFVARTFMSGRSSVVTI